MANAAIGIAPYINSMNYRLNTPNKFGEYLSAGLPIAVAVSGDMENLLNRYECGGAYFNSKDLIEFIEKYYLNEELLVKHSKNARVLYEEMYNADTFNQKLLNHIENISIAHKEKN